MSQRRIPQKVRDAVYERDGYRCFYCGCSFWRRRVGQFLHGKWPTLDHVIPQAKGGSDEPSNLVTACKPCNSRKGARSLKDFQ